MPRKPWYNCILDAGTTDNTQNISAQTFEKNTSFCPLRIETRLAPSTQKDAAKASARFTKTKNVAEPAQISSEDEDYDPEADEVESWDDHVDNLYAAEKAVRRGVTRTMNLSIKDAIVLPPGRQIILEFNTEIQAIGQATGLLSRFLGSLGANVQHFPINEESWKTMDNDLKEHAYDTIKRTFLYEEDDHGKKRKSFEENPKRNPSGINAQQWKWFVNYRFKESTKEKKQRRRISRGEMFIVTHKKRDGLYMNDDAHVIGVSIG
ncbi:hypothetical protein AHAS_Ahas17G0180100 [Arachis hypogaea]